MPKPHPRYVQPTDTDILVCPLGYLSGQSKQVLARSGDRFYVLDENDAQVFEGLLVKAPGAFGPYVVGDFSQVKAEGRYRIVVGTQSTQTFPVGSGARKKFEDAIHQSAFNWFKKQRSGNTTENWEGRPIHLDDGKHSDHLKHQDFSGGWKDACDRRKYTITTVLGLRALLAVKNHLALNEDENKAILEEIRWGNDFAHKMQDPDGHLYSFSLMWPNDLTNKLTDNIPGTSDDRLFFVDRISLAVHYNFIADEAGLYRVFKNLDPAYAEKCLRAARHCFAYCVQHFEEMNAETVRRDPVRAHLNPDSDMRGCVFDNFATGMMAGLEMFRATGDPHYKAFALKMADKTMALQETGYIGNQRKIKGFFYEDSTKSSFVKTAINSQLGLIGLCELCREFPADPQAPQWKRSIRLYLDDYLLPLADLNAFDHLPYGLWRGKTKNPDRQLGDLYFRYFKGEPEFKFYSGRTACILGLAEGLAKAGKIFSNPHYTEVAWRQVAWVLGRNPFGVSVVSGAGWDQLNYRPGYAGEFPTIAGGARNGILGDQKDLPEKPNGDWRTCEYWIPNVSYFLTALAELLDSGKTEITN